MTVIEAIQKSAEFLDRKGVESPRLQVELILASVLNMPRMNLYLNFERPLSAEEIDLTREKIRRRGSREPLQHILGSVSFCGLEIAVNRHVLIPRPETEILAEHAWTLLKERARAGCRPLALDFGTGSGCLAIALAARCPQAEIMAIDISAEALRVARANAARHQVEERVRFLQSGGLPDVHPAVRFDVIVSNPPYIPTAEIELLEPEVRDHDPRQALDGGPDGLDCIRRLAAEARAPVREDGVALVEFGDGQAEAVRAIFSASGWTVEAIEKDDSGRERFVRARLLPPAPDA